MIDSIIERIRPKLPIQNPLHTFVHNNVMQLFEGRDFHDAVMEAGRLYRGRPYWPLHRYLEHYQEGYINADDISEGIDHYLTYHLPSPRLSQLKIEAKDFYKKMMFSELNFNDDEIQPKLEEEKLWELVFEKLRDQELILSRSSIKLRAVQYWERYHSETISLTIHPFIIRLISSYLDQGQSFWGNPFSSKSFLDFFKFDVLTTQSFATGWQKILVQKVKSYEGFSAQEMIEKELSKMGISQDHWEEFILEILFDLKGWAGMVNKLELEPWQATVKAPGIKLVDYVAMLILVESSLDTYHAEAHSLDLSLIYGRKEQISLKGFQLSLAFYQITKNFGLASNWFESMTSGEMLSLIDAIDEAEHLHKIRLWHEAYEQHFYREAITALSGRKKKSPKTNPYAQVLFCIDDREESIRRHLEETDPGVATYGVVGFFGIDMQFSSLRSQKLVAQCPPVIKPSRIVRERTKNILEGQTFEKLNKLRGVSDLALYYHSRTLFRGILSTLTLGMACIAPMFMQVFFPHQSDSFMRLLQRFLKLKTPRTEIAVEKSAEGEGYSTHEMAKIVGGILNMCGIKNPVSPLVILLAHGSSSTNNPFKQAYGCGACGGNAGIPNSRAFARMANKPEVRKILLQDGFNIPDSTYFVAGFHDTCTDDVHFYDLETFPKIHTEAFIKVRASIRKAAMDNAFERCQRFSSLEAQENPENAMEHVHERAHDLAQPRPEYGHSKNALAIVGPRELTEGLYLNRRSFLLTYDWKIDPDGSILKQVVLGGVPVCVNINMDYYFSSVDNENFGCGSKLPLNLTSLLGVMTGSLSDLRIGLARQMVEIHEPIRNMTIIEAPLERVRTIFENHPRLKNLLYNQWMHLVVSDPEKDQWFMFKQGSFQSFIPETASLKRFTSSIDLLSDKSFDKNFAEIVK